MRAGDRNFYRIRRIGCFGKRWRHSFARKPRSAAGRHVQMLRERAQGVVGKGLAHKGDSERQSIGRESRRHRDGAKTQQVAEIRVCSQLGVERDGVSQHLLHSECARRGRQQQCVHFLKFLLALPPERLEFVQALECRHRVEIRGTSEDCPYRRIKGGLRQHGRRESCLAFGHPGAFVKQGCDFPERLVSDLHRPASRIGDRAAV